MTSNDLLSFASGQPPEIDCSILNCPRYLNVGQRHATRAHKHGSITHQNIDLTQGYITVELKAKFSELHK